MIKKLIVVLLLAYCSLSYAQTVKTDVLVIGGGASGAAAAMQCARSKVKTIFAVQGTVLGGFRPGEVYKVEAGRNTQSGAWGEFRKHLQDSYKKAPGNDTTYNSALRFEADSAESILKKMTDTTKDINIYYNASFKAIKKDGDRWEVSITQNEKTIVIKARVVIDATNAGEVAEKAGAKSPARFDNYQDNSKSDSYRTSVAAGEAFPIREYKNAPPSKANYPPFPAYCIPMNAILLKDVDNVLITERALPGDKIMQCLPLQFMLGQGAGTVAAYCAFFKTTTKNLRVRIIQGELLDFKGNLLPFTDIPQSDRNWRAIQQVCATGLLKGVEEVSDHEVQFLFRPDSLVSTVEIKPVLMEIYTRAFLWFGKEKPGEKFTIGNLLSFISDYTLTAPQTLLPEIQKAWKTQYKFKSDFDLNRQVTRRELAVLVNRFLNPFARTVDLEGRLVN